MDFFEHQDRARKRSLLLIFYFLLAILAIVAVVNLVCYLAIYWGEFDQYPPQHWLTSTPSQYITAACVLVVIFGSGRKLWQLRDGGTALAHMVGAVEVPADTPITDEHQLINIVEEMSIASGIPAPRVFVMRHEKAINAFVAGFRPTETVLVVTQGTLDHLSRDEVQGIIAHEFSHIFNADMKLNLRLLAGLAGILAIGKVGEILLHGNTRVGRGGSGRSEVSGVAAMIAVGLALMLIGYIGLFFGRLIKAAISRQRELLADASAVQFTRQPSGIAGALIKIRNGTGSRLLTGHAEDMSHMCFGDTVKFLSFGGLLATHPPVDERLEAIGPEWAARARVRARQQAETAGAQAGATTPVPEGAAGFAGPSASAPSSGETARASRQVGRVTPEQMGYAHSIYEAIPMELRRQIRESGGAVYAVQALAISASKAAPDELVKLCTDNRVEQRVILDLVEEVRRLGTRLRLPILDLAIPTLKRLPETQRDSLLSQLDQLTRADRRITLFEFCLTRILAEHLAEGAGRNLRIRFRRLTAVQDDCRLLLSLMVHAGGLRGEEARSCFRRAASGLLPDSLDLLPRQACDLAGLEKALERLQALTPLLKAPVVDACAFAVMDDNKVQVAEAELLRAVCTLLDCPMPPLFEGNAA